MAAWASGTWPSKLYVLLVEERKLATVIKGQEDQFFKLAPSENQLLTSFDYDSIMLYGSLTFSKDKANRLRTMEGKDGRYLKDVNTKKLSEQDIKRINMLYDCK
ncbi:metalloendopeptidase [Caerostris darwini]|uniref:Metalloendopeptidase n=1 Tax=Caerostris darwini TaxID=1538125 RepID=A0AAV4UK25_9ARAC|nr:metalloendopeptidase [Caerostris darwini]